MARSTPRTEEKAEGAVPFRATITEENVSSDINKAYSLKTKHLEKQKKVKTVDYEDSLLPRIIFLLASLQLSKHS